MTETTDLDRGKNTMQVLLKDKTLMIKTNDLK